MSNAAPLILDPKLPPPNGALHVTISREPFMDWFTITLDNSHTEDLEPDEVRNWFRERGSNMVSIEAALDYAWNFYYSEVYIANPKEPVFDNVRLRPKI